MRNNTVIVMPRFFSQTLMLTNQGEENKKHIDSVERKITVLDRSCTLGTLKSLPDVTFQ